MIQISQTVYHADGTETTEIREVPDDFFTPPAPEPTTEEKLRADVDFLLMTLEG